MREIHTEGRRVFGAPRRGAARPRLRRRRLAHRSCPHVDRIRDRRRRLPAHRGRFRRLRGPHFSRFRPSDQKQRGFSRPVAVGRRRLAVVGRLHPLGGVPRLGRPPFDRLRFDVGRTHQRSCCARLRRSDAARRDETDRGGRRGSSGGRERLEFHAETRIDRLAFGINSGYPLASSEVDLEISSEAEAI